MRISVGVCRIETDPHQEFGLDRLDDGGDDADDC